jgi:hypothetical protein
LVNQQAVANGRAPVGFVNPALYAIGKGTNYGACFHDITTGNNFHPGSPNRFAAVAGFDLCTGWGVPAGQPLINALAGGSNLPPVFNNNPFLGPSANVGQPVSGSISNQASAPNPADRLTFARLSGPAWLSIGSDGSLGGTPTGANVGTNTFLVSVVESAGMSNTATMYLNVNGAPYFAINTFTGPPCNAGQAFALSISGQVDDPNPGDTLAFTKLDGPDWLIISASGSISGTPGNTDAGTNVFTIAVTDGSGLSDTATLYVQVNGAPSFMADPFTVSSASVDQTYLNSITNQVTDPNSGSTLSFSKLSGPAWLVHIVRSTGRCCDEHSAGSADLPDRLQSLPDPRALRRRAGGAYACPLG